MLDDRRLGKQRVETFQALRALTWPQYGWKHHPVVKMWRGFVPALVSYGLVCVEEWRARGRADATRGALLEFTGGAEPDWDNLHDTGAVPPWVGDEALHLSHRSALVRKEPEHYRPVFGDVPDDLPYVWPDAAFPRWPLRRRSDNPLPLADALALLGMEAPPPGADEVVSALLEGHDVRLPTADASGGDPQSVGLATGRTGSTGSTQLWGLLAGFCTPGTTLWVVDRPSLPTSAAAPEPREGTGAVSGAIARQPSNSDRVAMAEEAEAEPEFRFVRRDAATRTRADAVGAGLVVTPASADPGAGNRAPAPRPALTGSAGEHAGLRIARTYYCVASEVLRHWVAGNPLSRSCRSAPGRAGCRCRAPPEASHLLDDDERRGSSLVLTPSHYLDAGGRYDTAAGTLAIGRSTVRYRLARIRELSGHDLAEADTCFQLHLATKAWLTRRALSGR